MKKLKNKNFTLVEILVVLAIMGIMLGITLPNIGNLTSGGAVGNGASNVSSLARYARSYALSNREYVAIITPDSQSLSKDNFNCYKAFRAAVVKKERGNSNYFVFEYWLEDSDWSFLANGSFVSSDSADGAENTIDIVDVDLEALDGPKEGTSLGMVIAPSGKPIVKTTDDAEVIVGQGSVLPSGKIDDRGKEKNRLRIVCDRNTGRIEVREL